MGISGFLVVAATVAQMVIVTNASKIPVNVVVIIPMSVLTTQLIINGPTPCFVQMVVMSAIVTTVNLLLNVVPVA